MVVHRNKILVLRRKDPDVWEFPGGNIEFGEHPKIAAVRELEEETGIKVEPENLKLLCVSSCLYPDGRTQQIQVLYVCELKKAQEKIELKEHIDYKWVSLEELQNVSPIALSVKACMNDIKRYFLEKPTRNFTEESIFVHLVEEIGEIAREIVNKTTGRKEFSSERFCEEIADALLFLLLLSEIEGISLEKLMENARKKLRKRLSEYLG